MTDMVPSLLFNHTTATCPFCGTPTSALTPWAWRCTPCDLRFSSLEPHIDDGNAALLPDEERREAGLRALRQRGYAKVLDQLERHRPLTGLEALDVGCGHGWFLEVAAARGINASGVEPDHAVAARAVARGLDVRVGFFPQDVPTNQRYDLITFNDVLEHLPQLPEVLSAVWERLRPGGILALSIPTAQGLGYRVATALHRIGISSPLDRLWQRGFPSPHLWYFTERSLTQLVTRYGFRLLATGRLPSVERTGLRERVAADPRGGLLARVSFATVYVAAPLLNSARFSDAMWLLCERPEDGDGSLTSPQS